jgi:glyoxylase-like metal-dependent hydrolase (beta-lactamase superfamily II)
MTVDQLRRKLECGEPVEVVDIRRGEERAEWHIPGSVHLDVYDAVKMGDPHAFDGWAPRNGGPVVAVCAGGVTSLLATELLRARGVPAFSLAGGMRAWSLAWNAAEVAVPRGGASVVQVRRTGKGCLSYLVAAGDEAAAIDACLDPRVYLELAARRGWTIRKVLETHVHADHLMRGRRLAQLAGATLHIPEQHRVLFPFEPLADGETITLGTLGNGGGAVIEVVHTPGHTPESCCYLLDGSALFSGDTLFLAGVGRPDLAASPEQARERAHQLYASLRRILALPDETLVLPAHTASPVPFDSRPIVESLGEVSAHESLVHHDEAGFVEAILARIPATPPNYLNIVQLNEMGVLPEGDPADLEAGANRCAVV